MTESKYCGFLCDQITEKQEEIADEIAQLWRVNPEFATQFAGRMIRMLVESVSPPPVHTLHRSRI